MVAPAPVPPLPDAPRVTSYAPVAAAGPFNVSFAIYGDSSDYTAWVLVTLDGVEQTGNWVLDSPSGSLITLARPITDARITFTAPITGALVITGAERPRRLAQNAENRGVTARDFNQTYTAVIAMLRETWDRWGRTLLVPPGESIGLMPSAAARALQMLGFDGAGNPIAAQPSSALVSSAMQDVVAAPSHAAALALLGGAPLSAIIPIGMPAMWPSLIVPSLWLPRDGTTRLRAGFPELWNVLAPTMTGAVASGSTDITGIPSTAGWSAGWPIEGAGIIAPGATIATVLSGTSIRMTAPAIGNGAAFKVYPYGAGDGVNSFALPDATGYVEGGLDLAQTRLAGGQFLNARFGSQTAPLSTANLPAHNHPVIITDPTHPHGKGFNPNAAGQAGANNITTTTAPQNTDAAATGITGATSNTGGGTAHANVQPTQIYLPIIYAGR